MNRLTMAAAATAIAMAVACMGAQGAAPGSQSPSGAAAPASAPAGPLTPLVEDILSAAGTRTGLCVVPNCGSGEFAADIVRRSSFFVQALEDDEAKLDPARRTLDATGEYGRRTAAERGSLSRLPYPDYCANLIVCDLPALPRSAAACWTEVMRVLRPGGLAYVGQSAETAGRGEGFSAEALKAQLAAAGIASFDIVPNRGVWARIRRARPEGMGDWSHGRWGTAGNNPCADDKQVKAPFHTQWIAGPNSFTKFGLALASNGRVLLRHGGITHEGRYTAPPGPDLIQAFDAYNGDSLWERRLEEREGEGLVAVGNRIFAAGTKTLYALDATDGLVAWRLSAEEILPGMRFWGQFLSADGVLVAALCDAPPRQAAALRQKALVGLSPTDGSVIWRFQPADGIRSFALGEGLCFHSNPRHLAALRLADGQEAWRRLSFGTGMVRYHKGKVYLDSASFAAADGKPGATGNFRGVLVGDRVYAGGLKGVTASDLATGAANRFPVPRDPYCPKTGVPDGCSFMYGRCIIPTASTHCYFFSYGGTVVGDLVRNELFPCESIRSNCRTGVIAGNGLVYNSPSGCNCSFAVRGGVALAPVDESLYWCRPGSNPPPQLEKGPAFGDDLAAVAARNVWPCFRHDPARSSVTDAPVPWPLKTRWQVRLPGKLTPPVAASGSVFLASDNHSVYALDAATGATWWRFVTGGEIWASPAWWQGRLFLGSQDGWVYCLRADTGRLVWRFRGAPHERKMLFYGRPQSLWPIGGGVIVEDGKVQFYAGRCSHDRVFVWSLDARTGEVLWSNDKAGRAVEVTGPEGGISPHGVSPSGVVAASKDVLYLPQGPFAPAASRADGRLLWWGRRGDSTQRSNIEVQNLGGPHLVVGEGLLFMGGPDPTTGSSQAFVAVDARTGRMWGADDPRLLAKAGRDAAGRAVEVKKAVFGTKPIRFGQESAPVVVDGGVFCGGYRGTFLDLKKHLETQFERSAADAAAMGRACLPGPMVVAGDKVLIASPGRLVALARAGGRSLGQLELATRSAPLPDGLAAAENKLFLATTAGEVLCLADDR